MEALTAELPVLVKTKPLRYKQAVSLLLLGRGLLKNVDVSDTSCSNTTEK